MSFIFFLKNRDLKYFNFREEYLDILTYHVGSTDMKWSAIFGLMEDAKSRMHIEDYSMGQMSLEQVFLLFTKMSMITSEIN